MSATNRRHFLGLMPLAALAACTSTTDGKTTAYALDTAKIDQDGSAVISALAAVLAAPSIAILLGTNLPVAEAGLAAAKIALAEFDSLTAGSQVVAIDNSELTARVSSFITNVQTVLTLVQGIMPKIQGGTAFTVGNYVAAILTLIPIVQLAAGMAGVGAVEPLMTEANALRIAGH